MSTTAALDEVNSLAPAWMPPFVVKRPEGDDWVRLADLADTGTGALRLALGRIADTRGYPDPKTQGAGFALITSVACAGLVHRAALGRTVPLLRPESTWWQLRPTANVAAVALTEAPAMAPPTAAVLAGALHGVLDGLYAAIREGTGYPIRAQWALFVSTMAHWCLELFPDDHVYATSLAASFFEVDDLFRVVKPRISWVETGGRRLAVSTRRVCCLNYNGSGGHYCITQCPVLPVHEREAHAIEHYRHALEEGN